MAPSRYAIPHRRAQESFPYKIVEELPVIRPEWLQEMVGGGFVFNHQARGHHHGIPVAQRHRIH
jgi:hypothetical protein